LFERLTDVLWSDGAARDPDTLFIFFDGERWKAMLKDREAQRVAFVSGASLWACLEALESGLVGEVLDWRADRSAKPKKR
jgi:hypothetical protein